MLRLENVSLEEAIKYTEIGLALENYIELCSDIKATANGKNYTLDSVKKFVKFVEEFVEIR